MGENATLIAQLVLLASAISEYVLPPFDKFHSNADFDSTMFARWSVDSYNHSGTINSFQFCLHVYGSYISTYSFSIQYRYR